MIMILAELVRMPVAMAFLRVVVRLSPAVRVTIVPVGAGMAMRLAVGMPVMVPAFLALVLSMTVTALAAVDMVVAAEALRRPVGARRHFLLAERPSFVCAAQTAGPNSTPAMMPATT
jgi:hypothetical protein